MTIKTIIINKNNYKYYNPDSYIDYKLLIKQKKRIAQKIKACQVGGCYNGKLTKVLGISVSYSMINKSFVNGGVGLTLNGGPFQYYLVADNVLGMIKYKNANTVDFRTGINFTFRRKDKQAGLSGKSKKLG